MYTAVVGCDHSRDGGSHRWNRASSIPPRIAFQSTGSCLGRFPPCRDRGLHGDAAYFDLIPDASSRAWDLGGGRAEV